MGVEAVAQRGPRQPRLGEDPLCRGVVAPRPEGRARGRALVARVQDPADACRHRGVDGGAVQRDRVGGRVARGHEQQLIGPGECPGQRSAVRVVAVPDLDAAFGEGPGLRGVACDHRDLPAGQAREEMLGGRAVQGASGPGNHDHQVTLPVSNGIMSMVALETSSLTSSCYR